MREAKDTARATVNIGFDGRVYKRFQGSFAKERFENEVRVLKWLEKRGCTFVPRVIEADASELLLVTTNCGNIVHNLRDSKLEALFKELGEYGVKHGDPFTRNITYSAQLGRLCIIDFEFATIEETGEGLSIDDTMKRKVQPECKVNELRWTAQTHAGRVRRKNEDSFLAMTFDSKEVRYLGKEGELSTHENDFVFAVSDGIGGAAVGEYASQITLKAVTELISQSFHLQKNTLPDDQVRILREFCRQIHDEVIRQSSRYQELQNMGATLSLGWVSKGTIHFLHVGDSRIYHLPKNGGLNQLTDDHTKPGELFRQGKIDEKEARNHPLRNILNQSVGSSHRKIEPQVDSVALETGDTLVFCSDGIVDGLWDRGIEKMIRVPPPYLGGLTPAERLVKEALDSSGRDNLTALVVEVR